MVWSLMFALVGAGISYMAVHSEQQNKIHLSRNNWSSFWNGALFIAGLNIVLANLLILIPLGG